MSGKSRSVQRTQDPGGERGASRKNTGQPDLTEPDIVLFLGIVHTTASVNVQNVKKPIVFSILYLTARVSFGSEKMLMNSNSTGTIRSHFLVLHK
jgi:hypothetical protein